MTPSDTTTTGSQHGDTASAPESPLQRLLARFRAASSTHREAGTYFEELTAAYFRHEPMYRERYREVLTYADWAEREGWDRRDTGIDLVGLTFDGGVDAIQCKLYAPTYRLQKADIDSFFTASGKRPFTGRVIVSTTDLWGEHAEAALVDQQPPVTRITLADLEASLVDWSRFDAGYADVVVTREKKSLRPHQTEAIEAVVDGLKSAARGKLIMACGTGKTFTSLKLAERMVGAGGHVLFLVPSLSLLSQTLTEWTQESAVPLRSFAVCSDSEVGKRTETTATRRESVNADRIQPLTHDLRYPATTDARRLAEAMAKGADDRHMTVVFSTYQSLQVVHDAQHAHDLPMFDLILCDEAHRTTGQAGDEGDDESAFVRIHDAAFVRGKRRLYMTATPRVYSDVAKARAMSDDVAVYSMDDEARYGRDLHVLSFSEAVKRELLVDYKVIVLALQESHVSRAVQELLKSANNSIVVSDATRIVGCWKALAKQALELVEEEDLVPMRRAVAFCQVIERRDGAKKHKVASRTIADVFQKVVEAYQASSEGDAAVDLRCEVDHIDGTMGATEKSRKIQWLKSEPPDGTCRILSNVRCLSEGVDVPALDAVLFLTPRSSQVDVVQSVGRVMRRAEGKKRGYVVLPVVVPAGMEAHEALDDNESYRVVWQVLQALRSHDDKFDAMINKIDINGADRSKMEVIALVDTVKSKRSDGDREQRDAERTVRDAKGSVTIGGAEPEGERAPQQMAMTYEVGEIEQAIYAKIVKKVGNRHHWEDWAKDVAKIARTHIDRIAGIVENPANQAERAAFDKFVAELRDDLNESVTRDEVVEMLAQHLITRPVFDALFAGQSFVHENSMSRAMQGVLEALDAHRLDKESATLKAFYESVQMRAEGIESAEGRQKIVVELYDKFFRNAFPRMSERLGIVYTPIEIVDFILHSVDDLLRAEFGQTLASPDVHILDPFTGTGTFITRLLQSGLIPPDALPRKYANEIHANELVLLAYYIAAINIESAYHSIVGGDYKPFEGICLTDTFQLLEKEDLVSQMLVDNSARRKRQKALDIRVIIGNPPYSIGQTSENDNNANIAYPALDERVRETYVEASNGGLAKGLYDSYVRAIRWASDRVGNRGIIGFVTNANFVEAASTDGMRKCLAAEFSRLYVFHLRGNQRTAGERSRREGGKVFGSGSRAPVAISLLVKSPDAAQTGDILFCDIGDYLTREEKLAAVRDLRSVAGVEAAGRWSAITPDAHGDWLKQRDGSIDHHLVAASKRREEQGQRLFDLLSLGVVTNRDAWAFSPSRLSLEANLTRMLDVCNAESRRIQALFPAGVRGIDVDSVGRLLEADPARVSWTFNLKRHVLRGRELGFDERRMVTSLYRPYSRDWLYYDRALNERVYQMPWIFPFEGGDNLVIGVPASASRSGFSALMTDVVPSLHAADMVGSQFFPRYVYEIADGEPDDTADDDDAQQEIALDDTPSAPRTRRRPGRSASYSDSASGDFGPRGSAAPVLVRRDAVTDEGLAHFVDFYADPSITKDDLFYYFYGILHSEDYRERYADNLGKELPRVPRVLVYDDFRAFVAAGRALGALHVGYERVAEFAAQVDGPAEPTAEQLRVEKMKFGKGSDRSTIVYNTFFTVRGVPSEAYEYVVNGKSAIEWVMERQAVSRDKASGIVKDANAWATETAGDPRYPLSLLLRVITVSVETVKIVRGLPALVVKGE